MSESFDAIVIGTGQAGPALASRFAAAGKKVAVLERHLFGGTCVNVGCIPTKTLVASARAAYMARRAADFGIRLEGSISVDMAAVKARKDRIVAQSNTGVTNWMRKTEGITVFEGHGRFAGPHLVEVDGTSLEAPRIFVNVGGRAAVPPIPGLDQVDYLTNSSIMELTSVPEHLVIVGGSYIGLEFAQMFRRFGSRVTVVEKMDRLIPRDDVDVSDAVQEILTGEGVDFRLDADCISVGKHPDGLQVGVECADGSPVVVGTHLLLAVGRRPNTDDLGLDQAGIETDERGYIKVNDRLETSQEGVYAVGDVNGRGAFTHTAYNDHEIVADNLLQGADRKVSDRILTYGLFIDPPLGRAGMTEAEVRNSGRRALIGRMDMSRVGRARERSETQGFMKVLVDAETERILGASLLGIGADEVVHALLDVMYADAPYTVIRNAVHIHPTVTELIPTLLGSLKPLD